MIIGLIGYRGSGKTTAGRALAGRMGLAFVDTDDLLVRRAGKTIREIFEQLGEPAFRDLESEIVRESCQLTDAVISFGGGALDRQENRDAAKSAGCRLIYLRCDPGELFRRIQGDPQTATARPHLTKLGGSVEEIRAVLARREPVWREILSAEVDVTKLTVDKAVEELERLTNLSRAPNRAENTETRRHGE